MKKLRLSRPVHGALCILGMLLILAAVRLLCGPPAAWGPKAALRRQERQSMLPRGKVEARWDRLDFTYLADRQPNGDLLIYSFCPDNTVTYYGPELKPKGFRPIRFYRNQSGSLIGNSREVPWNGASFFSINYSYADLALHSVSEAHLLFENGDPTVQRAEFRCTSVSEREEWPEPLTLNWTASAERLTPRLFDLTLTKVNGTDDWYREERWNAMLTIADGGRSPSDSSISLDGEVIWYDADGRELYRQKLDFWQEEETEAGA